MRGVNKMSVWDNNDPTGATYFPEIRKTRANTVRIVWAITKEMTAQGTATDLATLDALITNSRASQLIPMVELHDATGNWQRLAEMVNYWIQPDVVSFIKKHQTYLLVNIANEAGNDEVTETQFLRGYIAAVKKMRDAGIRVPLVIDAPGWGKNLDILNQAADPLLEADPNHNLIFSVHLYWPLADGADAEFIRSKLTNTVKYEYPLIVGEFSKYGGNAGTDEDGNPRSICSEFGKIDYQAILDVCEAEQIGWYAWEWGPGNGLEDPLCQAMDMTADGQFANLQAGWATDVVNAIGKAAADPKYFSLPALLQPEVLTRLSTLNGILSSPREQNALHAALQSSGGTRVLYLAEDQVTCLHEIQAFGWPPSATAIVPVQFDLKRSLIFVIRASRQFYKRTPVRLP
jgi:mannan endo-1,4-beta-mannosidase